MQCLTTDYGFRPNPHWSPDGQWIAFIVQHGYNQEIYRMRPDGTNPQVLATTPGFYLDPRWSPDGQWITFEENLAGSNAAIIKMRSDGRDRQQLSALSYSNRSEAEWSPPIQRDGHPWHAAGIGAALLGISLFRWRSFR
jgi:Tol biopolymer transport system component